MDDELGVPPFMETPISISYPTAANTETETAFGVETFGVCLHLLGGYLEHEE